MIKVLAKERRETRSSLEGEIHRDKNNERIYGDRIMHRGLRSYRGNGSIDRRAISAISGTRFASIGNARNSAIADIVRSEFLLSLLDRVQKMDRERERERKRVSAISDASL